METRNEKSRKCDICNIDIHRASFAKHLKKKHLETEKIIPSHFANETRVINKIETKEV